MLADVEGVLTDLRHRHPIGEQSHLRQHHTLARSHRLLQAIGIVRLDANDLDVWLEVFDVRSDASNQAAPTYRHEDRIKLTLMLAKDLHRHGALPGNHVRVVVGVDIDVTLFLDQLQ